MPGIGNDNDNDEDLGEIVDTDWLQIKIVQFWNSSFPARAVRILWTTQLCSQLLKIYISTLSFKKGKTIILMVEKVARFSLDTAMQQIHYGKPDLIITI
jgi:hypothetical protein